MIYFFCFYICFCIYLILSLLIIQSILDLYYDSLKTQKYQKSVLHFFTLPIFSRKL